MLINDKESANPNPLLILEHAVGKRRNLEPIAKHSGRQIMQDILNVVIG